MIMSRTPLRISFVGGGTDIREFYSKHGTGAVVSAAINKYIYVVINKKFDDQIRVSYSVTEIVDSVEKIKHPTVREALRLLGIKGGIEIVSISDIPSSGTGLGSSSSFLVGLLNALHAFLGNYVSPRTLAEEAVKIEREILGEPGGKQDQYMAAFGGLQLLEFHSDESVDVKPLIMDDQIREEISNNLLLMYTGRQRKSTAIHEMQKASMSDHIEKYIKMSEMAREIQSICASRKPEMIGRTMHENWLLKKTLSEGITDPVIDSWYETAMKNGAVGGKLIGAGGGGFMLFYVEPKNRQRVIDSLPDLRPVNFRFEYLGSRIIMVGD